MLKNEQVSKNAFLIIQSTGEFSGYPIEKIENNLVYIHPPKNGYNSGLYYLRIFESLENGNGDPLIEEVFYPL